MGDLPHVIISKPIGKSTTRTNSFQEKINAYDSNQKPAESTTSSDTSLPVDLPLVKQQIYEEHPQTHQKSSHKDPIPVTSNENYSFSDRDEAVFQTTFESHLLKCIELNLNVTNVAFLVSQCYGQVIGKYRIPTPDQINSGHKKMLEQIISVIEGFTNRMGRYFSHHYVCFNGKSKLQNFSKKQLKDVEETLNSTQLFAQNSELTNAVFTACKKIYETYERENNQILEIELKIATLVSEHVKQFCVAEVDRFLAESQKFPDLFGELESLFKKLVMQCMKIFENSMDLDGKVNEVIIDTEECLKTQLMNVLQAQIQRKVVSQQQNPDVTSDNLVTNLSGRFDPGSVLIFRLTMNKITVGRLHPGGTVELIPIYSDENCTFMGQLDKGDFMYGSAALQLKLQHGEAKFWSFKDLWTAQPLIENYSETSGILLGHLIRHLKEVTERQLKIEFSTTIVTVPLWMKKDVLIDVIQKELQNSNGFITVQIVDEIECLARAYLYQPERNFDFKTNGLLLLSCNSGSIDVRFHDLEENRIGTNDKSFELEDPNLDLKQHLLRIKTKDNKRPLKIVARYKGKENEACKFLAETDFLNTYFYSDSETEVIEGALYAFDIRLTMNKIGVKASRVLGFQEAVWKLVKEMKNVGSPTGLQETTIDDEIDEMLQIIKPGSPNELADKLNERLADAFQDVLLLAGCYTVMERKQSVVERFRQDCQKVFDEQILFQGTSTINAISTDESYKMIKDLLMDFWILAKDSKHYDGPHFTKEYRRLQERCGKIQRDLDKLDIGNNTDLRNHRRDLLIEVDQVAKGLSGKAHFDGKCCQFCELKD